MKAYKVFNSDWKCRDFQYEIGKTYELKDNKGNLLEPELCERGFHACLKVQHCFNYYEFNVKNKIAEVELSGTIIGEDGEKQCSNVITIIKEVSWLEMLSLSNSGIGNTGYSNSGDRNSGDSNSGDSNSGDSNSGDSNSGDRNSGYRNSGYRNSGYSNSGYRNSGHRNSGHRNSGDFNICDYETGFFNSITPKTINVFNKPCKRNVWESCDKPNFIYNLYLTKWISFYDMSDEEKVEYPKAFVCGGYLKTFTYKEMWANAYKDASENDIKLLKALPNYSRDVFEEITGIVLPTK